MIIELFHRIKYWPFYCYVSQGKEHLSTFQYSIDQPEFWSGPLFRKDCYEGRAYYEVNDHRSPKYIELGGDKARGVWPSLKINYPDSLLKLF